MLGQKASKTQTYGKPELYSLKLEEPTWKGASSYVRCCLKDPAKENGKEVAVLVEVWVAGEDAVNKRCNSGSWT